MTPDRQLIRLYQLTRILSDEDLELGERTAKLYENLFENEGVNRIWELGPGCENWHAEALDRALHYAREIIVRYTEYFYDPSHLPVTYYRRQRRVSSHLDQQLSPILREVVRRTGATDEPDLFLKEPIFYFKKEVRTRAYPKNKHGRVSLELMRERFRLLLMHRTAA